MIEESEDPKAVFAAVERRASTAKLETGYFEWDDGDFWLSIEYPNGRSTRQILYMPSEMPRLESVVFEDYRFLGDLQAVVTATDGAIEARVIRGDSRSWGSTRAWALPGVEVLDEGEDENEDDEDPFVDKQPKDWRLRVDAGKATIELSPTSQEMLIVLGIDPNSTRRSESLKIKGMSSSTSDEAIRILEQYGSAFLLDLDLAYGVPIEFAGRRPSPTPQNRRQSAAKQPPRFPSNKYAAEPLELYMYGRAASGLPLLEFLAYYQAVEFFLPTFARADIVHRVQNILKDPAFDARDELGIARLIGIAGGTQSVSNERESLRIVVRSCLEVSELENLISSSKRYTDHFCSKSQVIRGVQRIQLANSQVDLRDQVSDRLYAIRCRVVHTKEDGGDSGVELLLPSSREAKSLAPDVDLMRLIAQRVLVARSTPL